MLTEILTTAGVLVAGGLYTGYKFRIGADGVGPVCPNPLYSDWGRLQEITTIRSGWIHNHWEAKVQCYTLEGAIVEHQTIEKTALTGCPAIASLRSIAETRKLIDNICNSEALVAKLKSNPIVKRSDGTPLMYEASKILGAVVLGADGVTMSVSGRHVHKQGERWSPMAKDLWVCLEETGGKGELIFRKVNSLFRADARFATAPLTFSTVKESRHIPERKATLQLRTHKDAPNMILVERIGSFAGTAPTEQFIRAGWGQMRIGKVSGYRRLFKKHTFEGVYAECYSDQSNWDTSYPYMPLPLKDWFVGAETADVRETRNLIDLYCLKKMAGQRVMRDMLGRPLVFNSADILNAIDLHDDNQLSVSPALALRAGAHTWTQDSSGRWIPANSDAWVALKKRGPDGSILFHKVGSKVTSSDLNGPRKILSDVRKIQIPADKVKRASKIKLEARRTSTKSTIMEVSIVSEPVARPVSGR